jgi:UPF0755 protein
VSDVGLGLDQEQPLPPGRRRRRRRGPGCLAALVALAVLVGGGYLAYSYGISAVKDRFSGPEDYPGPGSGSVAVQVHEGDTAADIARSLVAEDVVKSAEAFVDAARDEPRSTGIQVGFYELRHQMAAADALDVLVDPANLVQSTVTVPEGLTVDAIVALLGKHTDIPAKQFRRALHNTAALGLPAYAKGNPEGYLFPATYAFGPDATAATMLKTMVDRWHQAADDADLEAAAARLGYTPAEVMVVASLVEAESNREQDRGKVARVIYNRLETDATNHLLQIDATVNYAHDRKLGIAVTQDDLQIDSPYNTYRNPGLPPTPIEAPGAAAIEAAAHPTPGDWVYYVTVNLRSGETKFARSYDDFLKYKAEYKEYCATQSDAC